MMRLISPTARTPIIIKAFIRWCIVKYNIRIRGRAAKMQEYGEGCDIPDWQGWIEQDDMAVAFIDTEGNYRYRW